MKQFFIISALLLLGSMAKAEQVSVNCIHAWAQSGCVMPNGQCRVFNDGQNDSAVRALANYYNISTRNISGGNYKNRRMVTQCGVTGKVGSNYTINLPWPDDDDDYEPRPPRRRTKVRTLDCVHEWEKSGCRVRETGRCIRVRDGNIDDATQGLYRKFNRRNRVLEVNTLDHGKGRMRNLCGASGKVFSVYEVIMKKRRRF